MPISVRNQLARLNCDLESGEMDSGSDGSRRCIGTSTAKGGGAQQETSAKAVQQVAGAEVRTRREDVGLKTAVSGKAVKSDKAGVPRHLWDCRVVKEGTEAWVQYTSGEWRPEITCVGGRCYRPSAVVSMIILC